MANLTLKVRPETYRHSDAVSFDADCVVKSVPPVLCAIEAWRTERGRSIGQATGSFYTPAIQAVGTNSITLERLEGLVNIRDQLNRKNGPHLAMRVGLALADIHRSGTDDIDWNEAPEGLQEYMTEDGSFYHGDFNTYNVLYDEVNDRLCILDWLHPGWATGHAFAHRRYFDLCVFIISTFSRRWLEEGVVRRPERIIDRFLSGYVSGVNRSLEVDELTETLAEVLSVFAAPRGGGFGGFAKIVRWPSFRMARRYCANLTATDLRKK